MEFKKFCCLFVVFLASMACSREGQPVQSEAVCCLEVLAGEPVTKTWTDVSGDGERLSVYWSDGDVVCVNGVESDPLSIGNEKVSRASFEVRNVEPPYSVLYPSSFYAGADENGIILNVPPVQKYTQDSFGNGSALMFGQAEDENSLVQMKHLCGAICVNIGDVNSTRIEKISLTALGGGIISGKFCLSLPEGKLRGEEGTSTVQLELPEGGVGLAPEGTNFVFTIPSGEYPDGFSLKFYDGNKRVMRCFWLRKVMGGEPGVEVKAGKMVIFDPLEYAPDAREICSAEDWNEFVSDYNLGVWESVWKGKDGVVRIGADFATSSLELLSEFPGEIDGCGHVITQTSVTGELIGKLSGKLCNLTLAGKFTSFPSSGNVSVFVRELVDGGLIENCRNLTDIDVSCSSKIVAAPFVRSLNGGVIKNCINDGEIRISVDVNNGDHTIVAAGISATSSLADASATICACMNNKPVVVTVVKDDSSPNRPLFAGYGGIHGILTKSDESHFLTIQDCVNNAPVSVGYSISPSTGNELISGAGGIIGMAARFNSTGNTLWYSTTSEPSSVTSEDCAYMVMENCINNGDVSNSLISKCSSDGLIKSYSGGLAGVLNGLSSKHISVVSCKNFGRVIPHEGKYARSAFAGVAGGLSGFGSYVDFISCTVNSPQIGTVLRQNYSAAGGIGYVTATFSMQNCDIFAQIHHIRLKDYTEDNYSMGFNLSTKEKLAGGVWPNLIMISGSSIKNCRFGGSFITNSQILTTYNGTTPAADGNYSVTAENVQDWIASKSFWANDSYKSDLTLESNIYWDGN